MVKGFRRILHPTDFSRASARALQQAIGLAQQNNAELWVLHVIVPLTYTAGAVEAPDLYMRLEERNRKDAENSMAKLLQKLRAAKVKVKSLLVDGTAHEQIIKAAKRTKADLIVMGTHGRSGISKLFMGSVAGRVVSTAECPVLTVRGK